MFCFFFQINVCTEVGLYGQTRNQFNETADFWAAAPKGMKACRTQGDFRLFVCSFVLPSVCPPQALLDLKSALSGLESVFSGLELALSGLKPVLSGLKPFLSGFECALSDSKPERADFKLERVDFRPERADFRPERA